MHLSSSKCTEWGKKSLVPQQKMLMIADRGSMPSLSGIKCVGVAFKMFVNAQNVEPPKRAKVTFRKHIPSSVRQFQFQECGICQPLGNPVLPVGLHLVQSCCHLFRKGYW